MVEEFKPSPPDYSGDGVAVWKAVDKRGQIYLKVSVLRGKPINCFKIEPKPETKPEGSI